MNGKKIGLMGLMGLMLALCGCVSNQELKDWGKRTVENQKEKSDARQQAEARQIECTYDQYTGTYSVTGAQLRKGFPWATRLNLRGGMDKTGEPTFYQLYIVHEEQEWKFLESAFDSEATELGLLKIDSEVLGANSIVEIVGVELSRDYLERHRESGLDLKIKGKRGEFLARVDGKFVSGFLDSFDGKRRGVQNTERIIQARDKR